MAVAFAAGFGWFIWDAGRSSSWPANADGIVALTGGALRVETGLALLRARVAQRLLISGAGPGVTLSAVLEASSASRTGSGTAPIEAGLADMGSVTLGHLARTTAGNAVETAWWAQANGLHSLIVVTAGYHMRRAMAEIGAALPGVELTPYAVHPPTGARTLLVEYVKLIATEGGLAAAAHRPGAT